VQGNLSPHFHRREIEEFRQNKFCGKQPDGKNLLNVDYIALSNIVSHKYSINNFDLCLIELSKLNNFKKIEGYKQLIVYKNKQKLFL